MTPFLRQAAEEVTEALARCKAENERLRAAIRERVTASVVLGETSDALNRAAQTDDDGETALHLATQWNEQWTRLTEADAELNRIARDEQRVWDAANRSNE